MVGRRPPVNAHTHGSDVFALPSAHTRQHGRANWLLLPRDRRRFRLIHGLCLSPAEPPALCGRHGTETATLELLPAATRTRIIATNTASPLLFRRRRQTHLSQILILALQPALGRLDVPTLQQLHQLWAQDVSRSVVHDYLLEKNTEPDN
jgi:hypothetical protein